MATPGDAKVGHGTLDACRRRRPTMAKITLVDDDENIVASVRLALESHGHTGKAYYDGVAGLAALESDPPDLALLDVKMPRRDGMAAIRRPRGLSALPGRP